jgi:hypothetical protein
MNVQVVYEKYTIPPNLQKHMLRVAALSQVITESWIGPVIDNKSILLTCLFHDMANIIKFNFSKPSLFKEDDAQADYWKKIQVKFVKKYGSNIHVATQVIAKEMGLTPQVVGLIKKLEWENIMRVIEDEEYESALTIYCDMRMGPYGILPLQERLDNLKIRTTFTDSAFYKKAAPRLEAMLQKYISIPLDSIDDIKLNKLFTELQKLEV